LLSIVIGVGLVTIFGALATVGLRQNMVAERRVEASSGFEAYEGFVRTTIARQVGPLVYANSPGGCATFGSTFRAAFPFYLGTLSGSLVSSANSGTLTAYVGSPEHEAAKQRCMQRQTLSAANSFTTGDSIYFCLLLTDTVATAVRDDGVSASFPVFAEVYYRLTTLDTEGSVKCPAFAGSQVPGGEAFFTLYWTQSGIGTPPTNYFQRYAGVIYDPAI
jgi:hypothetical protein